MIEQEFLRKGGVRMIATTLRTIAPIVVRVIVIVLDGRKPGGRKSDSGRKSR